MRKRLPPRRPHEQLVLNVRNQSQRNTPIRALVLHDTESHDYPGTRDLAAIGSWFDNPKSQASAHVCVDGEGISAQYVPDTHKAWHVAAYNSQTLGIEQIGFASFTKTVWNRNHRAQLKKVAKYLAWWSIHYGIPLRVGAVSQGKVTKSGVLTHAMLGQAGGGHHDPGSGYPLLSVLAMGRYYARRGWPH